MPTSPTTIRLSTAKKVLRHLREQGFTIVHRHSAIIKMVGGAGAVCMLSPRKIRVLPGFPFTVFLHEAGHALDFQRGIWRRFQSSIRRRTYAAEIAANREATALLRALGNEADVAAFRADMVPGQLRHRNRRRGVTLRPENLRDRLKTRYLASKIAGKPRFMFVVESPVRLRRSTRGDSFSAPDGTSIVIEWSGDGATWIQGLFSAAPTPESRRSDGTWIYRALSSIPHDGRTQFARLAVTI